MVFNIKKIATELQSFGIKVNGILKGRTGGAGPSEGITIIINGKPLCVPAFSDYVKSSPFKYDFEKSLVIDERDGSSFYSEIRKDAGFYKFKTREGIPFKKIALLHGIDCLGTTIFQTCYLWGEKDGCSFCGIGLSLKNGNTIVKKNAFDLAEVSIKAKELDGVKHITITTGTLKNRLLELSEIVNAIDIIKRRTGLPIQIQLSPFEDNIFFKRLKEAGADTIGIHIESFDKDVLRKVAPYKASLGIDIFKNAWENAVKVFGYGQVESFIIAGLGERINSIRYGVELLCKIGVFPFVLPFRPIPGTKLANQKPPEPDYMRQIYSDVSEIITRYKLKASNFKAGCVRCGSCSSLRFYEEEDL